MKLANLMKTIGWLMLVMTLASIGILVIGMV